MKSIYRKEDDSMHEQPGEMPNRFPTMIERFSNNYAWDQYEREKGLCRTIPCAPGHTFEDGKEYDDMFGYMVNPKDGKAYQLTSDTGVPSIPKQETQEDIYSMWKEVYQIVHGSSVPYYGA